MVVVESFPRELDVDVDVVLRYDKENLRGGV